MRTMLSTKFLIAAACWGISVSLGSATVFGQLRIVRVRDDSGHDYAASKYDLEPPIATPVVIAAGRYNSGSVSGVFQMNQFYAYSSVAPGPGVFSSAFAQASVTYTASTPSNTFVGADERTNASAQFQDFFSINSPGLTGQVGIATVLLHRVLRGNYVSSATAGALASANAAGQTTVSLSSATFVLPTGISSTTTTVGADDVTPYQIEFGFGSSIKLSLLSETSASAAASFRATDAFPYFVSGSGSATIGMGVEWAGITEAHVKATGQTVPVTAIGSTGLDYGGIYAPLTPRFLNSLVLGDVTTNGVVDIDDLLALSPNYGATSGKLWSDGDVNNDRQVNFNDLLILASRYTGPAPLALDSRFTPAFLADFARAQSLVPEPTSLVAIGSLLLVARRRSR